MGGYAGYVWPAYGVAAVILLALLFASIRQAKLMDANLALLEAAGVGRRNRRRTNGANQDGANDP